MITQAYVNRVKDIESSNNPLAKNPKSSAKGLFQFVDATAKQYGLNNYEFGTEEYTQAETRAFNTFSQDNYNSLQGSLGRAPTNGELYLAHQQGAGGAKKLLSDPNAKAVDVVGRDAVVNNGGNEDMSAKEFSQIWTSKFDDIDEGMRVVEDEPLPFSLEQLQAELSDRGIEQESPLKETGKENLQFGGTFSVNDIDAELLKRGRKDIIQQKKTESDILDLEEKMSATKDEEMSLSGRLMNIAREREVKFQKTKLEAQEQGVPYAAIIPQLGESAALLGDVGFELVKTGAKAVSPEFVELVGDGVGWAVSSVAETAPAKFVTREYGAFKEAYPLLSENIEGGIGVAMFVLPTAKVASAKSGVKNGQKVLENAEEVASKGIRPPVRVDTQKRALTRILKSSDKSYDELLDTLKTSDTLTIADIAGDEVQGLTRSLGKVKGAKNLIHDTLTQRAEQGVARVSNALSRNVSEVDNYFTNIDEIAKARSAAAKPLYKQAYKEALNINDTRLTKFLEDQRIKDAIITAKTKYGTRLEVADNSLEALDGAKKVLFDLESSAKRAGEGNLAGAYKELRQGLVDVLDDASPTYSQARKVYEHPSKLINAQESGRAFQKLRPEQIKKAVDNFSPDELEAYRIGVREKLQEIVNKTPDGADPARRIFGNTEKRTQIKTVFADEDNFKEFSKRMNDEIQSYKTRNAILGGSRTDYNLASDVGFIDAVTDASRRGLIDTAIEKTVDTAVDAIKKYYVGITDKNARNIADILLDRNKGIKALQDLIDAQTDMQQRASVGMAIKNHAPLMMVDD